MPRRQIRSRSEVGDVAVTLQEGSYASGGVGRFVYAAATALATLLARAAARGHTLSACPGDELSGLDVKGKHVVELGCGVGLVGLVAARCGAASVLMTDYSEASVAWGGHNAERNGLADCARSAELDWLEFATAAGAKRACEQKARRSLGRAQPGGATRGPGV